MANLTLNREDRTRTWGLILAGLIIFAGTPLLFNAGSGLACLNPPPNNPNGCHVYTWRNFPQDTGFTPITGMFGNDTSYYFSANVTGLYGFNLCLNLLKLSDSGNVSITLQFLNASDSKWWNAAQNGAKTGGSFWVFGAISDQFGCSSDIGVFPANLSALCLQPGDDAGGALGMCSFRIAGNAPITPSGETVNVIQISSLNVNFYSGGQVLRGQVLCSVISAPSLNNFSSNCSKTYPTAVSQSITVYWQATNSTGDGCGTLLVAANCWRFGSLTCTIPAGSTSCSNALVSFSPAFTVNNGRAWDSAWTANNEAQISVSLSYVYNVLT